MALAKRTYKISDETIRRFERLVPAGQRSQAVELALREKADEIEREALRRDIIEGLEYMADVNEETMREWAAVDLECWPEY